MQIYFFMSLICKTFLSLVDWRFWLYHMLVWSLSAFYDTLVGGSFIIFWSFPSLWSSWEGRFTFVICPLVGKELLSVLFLICVFNTKSLIVILVQADILENVILELEHSLKTTCQFPDRYWNSKFFITSSDCCISSDTWRSLFDYVSACFLIYPILCFTF